MTICLSFFNRRDLKLEPPGSDQTERKRTTRKKKLFMANDESLQDIDPVEIVSKIFAFS